MLTLIKNARIHTMDDRRPVAQAALIEDDRFVFVGSLEGAQVELCRRGQQAQEVDAKDRLMLPGLNDSHMHFIHFAKGLMSVNLTGTHSIKEIQERMAEGVRLRPAGPDAFVEGEGWNQDYFTESERRFPLRADLDEVSSTVPMMIMRACFHIGVLNSAALKALNITRETAPSYGDLVEVDENGEPNGIIKENPVLRLVLGTCSCLAVTTAVSSALGMGAAFTFVLVCSNILISLLRNVIPAKVHLPCYIVIIAGFVTIVQMVMHAYMDSLYTALGVFLPLIVVNCIILGRAEMFACKNSVVDSALDGIGMGIGYTLTVVLMASIREILGSGTWLGFKVLPDSMAKIGIMTQAPGAFFCFGLLMAGCVWLETKLDARIERKSCCDIDNLKKEAE